MPPNAPYRVVLRPAAGGLEAVCLDFEGCSALGATEAEALQAIRGAIAFYLETCPCDKVPLGSIALTVERRG